MSNPNNCATCKHSRFPDGGHCYMFRIPPTGPCMQHTIQFEAARAMRMNTLRRTLTQKDRQP